jgi:hypothetical protein
MKKTENHRIFTTAFASVYPHYVQKATRKGRTKEEVDEVIRWLTGYDAPALNPNVSKITASSAACASRTSSIH